MNRTFDSIFTFTAYAPEIRTEHTCVLLLADTDDPEHSAPSPIVGRVGAPATHAKEDTMKCWPTQHDIHKRCSFRTKIDRKGATRRPRFSEMLLVICKTSLCGRSRGRLAVSVNK